MKMLWRMLLLLTNILLLASVAFAGGGESLEYMREPAEGYYCISETQYKNNEEFYAATTEYQFDAAGNLTRKAIEDFWNHSEVCEYTYDSFGNCLKKTYYYDGEETNQCIYTYDGNNRRITAVSERLESESKFVYDDNGNLVEEQYCAYGLYFGTYKYVYNQAGQLVSEGEVDAGTGNYETAVTYQYQDGKLVFKDDIANLTKEYYEYDSQGRCTLCTRVYPSMDATYKLYYTYDENGNNIKTEEHAIYGDNYLWSTVDEKDGYVIVHLYEYEKYGQAQEEPVENPFTDVSEKEYYYQPVLWAAENSIVVGMSEDTFAPELECTRAQAVTFLWRLSGKPEPTTTECKFTDVQKKDYFYQAVLWATENGITQGTGNNKFSPDDTCTRCEFVTMLWRLQGETAVVEQEQKFSDVDTSDYFYNAVLWAVNNGVTVGATDTTFAPDEQCLRGQVVTFLYRFCVG